MSSHSQINLNYLFFIRSLGFTNAFLPSLRVVLKIQIKKPINKRVKRVNEI